MDFTELKEEIEGYRKIDEEFQDIIKMAFPGIRFEGAGNTGEVFRAYLSDRNGKLIDSDYFYKGSPNFFHLTTIKNLFSMLNSRSIRLYDLHSSDDAGEYGHAGQAMDLSDTLIENQKSRLFTFSFSPLEEIHNMHLWKEYGNDFAGVALVFEIDNDPKKWVNYHLASVKYSLPNELETYKEKLNLFQKKYNIKSEFDPSRLISFHKKKEFENEKEVRLVTFAPYEDTLYHELKHIKTDYRTGAGRNRITQYFEMPFWVDNANLLLNDRPETDLDRRLKLREDYFEISPRIKVKDVLIGLNSGLTEDELSRLKVKIEDIFLYQYGYSVNITDTLFQL